jgi:hypothetical protein
VLADGTRGPSLLDEPLIRIDVWVQTADRIDEVTYDMTAEQAPRARRLTESSSGSVGRHQRRTLKPLDPQAHLYRSDDERNVWR